MTRHHGLGPKSRVFIEEFAKVADGRSLDHMIGVAEAHAQDSLDKGDMDEHFTWGQTFHLLRGEKDRRRGRNNVGYLERR